MPGVRNIQRGQKSYQRDNGLVAAKRSQCSRLERGIPFVFAKNPFFSQLFQTSILTVVFSDSKKLVAIEDEKCMKPANSCDSAEKLFELMGAGNGRYVHDRCGVYGSRVVTHMLGRRDWAAIPQVNVNMIDRNMPSLCCR